MTQARLLQSSKSNFMLTDAATLENDATLQPTVWKVKPRSTSNFYSDVLASLLGSCQSVHLYTHSLRWTDSGAELANSSKSRKRDQQKPRCKHILISAVKLNTYIFWSQAGFDTSTFHTLVAEVAAYVPQTLQSKRALETRGQIHHDFIHKKAADLSNI